MKKLTFTTVLAVIAAVLWSFTAFAADVKKSNYPNPSEKFFVNDFANVLSDSDEDEIMKIGAALYKQTTAQVVVVTVNSLDGYNVKDYALELGRKWGVGDKEKNNGVVLLLAVSERQVTIQVGYGLEGRLTDGKTGRILDKYAIPYLKNNDFSTGLSEAYKAIVSEVYEEYGVAPPEDYKLDEYSDYDVSDSNALEIIRVIIVIIIILIVIFRRRGRRRVYFGPFFGGFDNGSNGSGGFFSGGGSSGGGFSGGGGSFGGGGSSRGF